MENNEVLPENVQELISLIKSRADGNDPDDKLLALTVACAFDSDGEFCDELIEHMTEYIRSRPAESIREIFEHLVSVLPPIEIVEDDDSGEVPA